MSVILPRFTDSYSHSNRKLIMDQAERLLASPINDPLPMVRTAIVFVEDNVRDLDALIGMLPPGTEVHVLNAAGDGLAQMAQVLAGRSGIDAVHLLSHGAPGELELGALHLTAQNVPEHAADLATIGAALSADADILLYGCDAGATDAGAALLSSLALATGADVAASSDPTGGSAQGGNWQLEVASGKVESASIGANGQLDGYAWSLIPTVTFGFTSGVTATSTIGATPGSTQASQTIGSDVLTLNSFNGSNPGGRLIVLDENLYFGNLGNFTGAMFAFDGNDNTTNSLVMHLDNSKTFDLSSFAFYNQNGSAMSIVLTTSKGAVTVSSIAFGGGNATIVPLNDSILKGVSSVTMTMVGGGNFIIALDDIVVANIAAPDTTPPTLAITSNVSALKVGQTATITFTFSEDPGSTFTWNGSTGDVAVSGGTLGAISGSGLTRSATFTPTASTDGGTASITVASNSYTDAAGNNGGAGTTPTLTFDTLAPNAPSTPDLEIGSDTGTGALASDDITGITEPVFTGTAESGVTVTLYDTNGTTVLGSTTATGGNWSITSLTLGEGAHTITAKTTDAAGNVSGASSSLAVTIDTTGPTLAITSNVTALKVGETATITFTFSEDPGATFTWNGAAGDVVVTGGTLGAIAGSGLTRTATFTPTASTNGGTASITAAASSYTDAAENSGGGGTTPSLTFDTRAPNAPSTPDLAGGSDLGTSNSDNLTRRTTPTFTGTAESGATVTLYDTDGTTILGTGTATGGSWTITSSTLSAGGHTISAKTTDAGANVSSASSGLSVTIDTTTPTLAITSNVSQLTAGETATITFTFSEDPGATFLWDGSSGDVVVSGGTLGAISGSGLTRTATYTPTADINGGTASITVASSAYTDAAGNDGAAGTTPSLSFDTLAPNGPSTPPPVETTIDGVVTLSTEQADPATGLVNQTITIPVIGAQRTDDPGTPNSTLADIPLITSSASGGASAEIIVSLPIGTGLQVDGATTLLTNTQAVLDLINRIEDKTVAGTMVQSSMTQLGMNFLSTLGQGVELNIKTLVPQAAPGASIGQAMVISGDAPTGTAIALVIDASRLPANTVLQLDNVEFAAVIGNVIVRGGSGQNYVIGDGGAQTIFLGVDDDKLFGGAGDDRIGSAGGQDYLDGGEGNDIVAGGIGNDTVLGGTGDDVLNGGRSDRGQWTFVINGQGQLTARHDMAVFSPGQAETLTRADLVNGQSALAFADAGTARLTDVAMLYDAAFNRVPDLAGINSWSAANISVNAIAESFLQSKEWRDSGGAALSDAQFLERVYVQTLNRASDPGGLKFWSDALAGSPLDPLQARAQVLTGLAWSLEHRDALSSAGGVVVASTNLAEEQGWIAGSGNDVLDGGVGSDVIVGGDGIDTVVYGAALSSYKVLLTAGGRLQVLDRSSNELDVLSGIELGQFGGATVDLGVTAAPLADLTELAGLYRAVLGRAPDLSGLQQWSKSGAQGAVLANAFITSQEFKANSAALSDAAFISLLYQNTGLQKSAAGGEGAWAAYLGQHTRAELVAAWVDNTAVSDSLFGTNGMWLF